YRARRRARAGEDVRLDAPFPISFDPARLSEME
ncbi:Uma2 family endonuclease, partial [Actinomadura logoneensis]